MIGTVVGFVSCRPHLGAALMGAAYTIAVAPSLGQPLLETHAYRQTQTAYTAALFAERGVDLFRPPLPVLGAPGIVPLEFPLFQAIAAQVIAIGVPADTAVRLTGLAAFLTTGALVYALALRLIRRQWALVTLAAFLFNPHALIYGRTALIDYLAAAFGLGFLLFTIRWMEHGRRGNWIGALVCASAMILVKVTTGPIFLFPSLAWRDASGEFGYRRPMLWLLLGLAAGSGAAWSFYADTVRSALPAAEFLEGHNILAWLIAPLESRFDAVSWVLPILMALSLTGFGIIVWVYLASRYAQTHRQCPALMTMIAMTLATPVVLLGAYAPHEYYYAALAPFFAIIIGMGVARIAQMPVRPRSRLLAIGLAGAWIGTVAGSMGSWAAIYGAPPDEARVRSAAAFLREHSKPDDWIVVEGMGWNPTILYYARRQAFADPTGDNLVRPGDVDLDAIRANPTYGPFFVCDDAGCRLRTESDSDQVGDP